MEPPHVRSASVPLRNIRGGGVAKVLVCVCVFVLSVKGGPLQLIRLYVSRTSRYKEHVNWGK